MMLTWLLFSSGALSKCPQSPGNLLGQFFSTLIHQEGK